MQFRNEYYFLSNMYPCIKLSPINENEISEKNHMGSGIIEKRNLM